MCPCARSRRRGDARTGTDGGVRRLRLHAPVRAFLAVDLRCSRCHLAFAVFLAAGFGLGVPGPRASVMRWFAASACLSMPSRWASPLAMRPCAGSRWGDDARTASAERLGEQFIEFFGELDGLMPSEPDE